MAQLLPRKVICERASRNRSVALSTGIPPLPRWSGVKCCAPGKRIEEKAQEKLLSGSSSSRPHSEILQAIHLRRRKELRSAAFAEVQKRALEISAVRHISKIIVSVAVDASSRLLRVLRLALLAQEKFMATACWATEFKKSRNQSRSLHPRNPMDISQCPRCPPGRVDPRSLPRVPVLYPDGTQRQ